MMNAAEKPASTTDVATVESSKACSPQLPNNNKFLICNGLRYAVPYDFTSKPMTIKDRFVGERLDVVLGYMFRRHKGKQPLEQAAAHWSCEVRDGRVQLRSKKKSRDDPWQWRVANDPSEIVKSRGTCVRIQQHVHEKVVPHIPRIDILFENERCFAINKPGGLATVDEMGPEGINSLMNLIHNEIVQSGRLGADSKPYKLAPAHRLDKPVSGVLLVGKSPGKAAKLLREIHRGTDETEGVKKIYIARVKRNPDSISLVVQPSNGSSFMTEMTASECFPDEIIVEAELGWNDKIKRTTLMGDMGTEVAAERALARKASLEGCKRKEAKKKEIRQISKGGSSHEQQQEDENSNHGMKRKLVVSKDDGEGEGDASNNHDQEEGETDKVVTKTQGTHTTRFRRQTQLEDGTVLVECQPLTGHRHQIRAHLASIGWPIANDAIYGGSVCFQEKELLAYVDDEAGTLQRVLGSPQARRSWCTKCDWTMKMIAESQHVAGKTTETNGCDSSGKPINAGFGLPKLPVEGGIWLHSHRYVLPAAGLDIVAPLPGWAKQQTQGLSSP